MIRWEAVTCAFVASAVCVAALAACTNESEAPERLPGRHLTRDDFNTGTFTDIWPLTVDEGTLSCLELRTEGETTYAVVFTTNDGNQFGLNGTASNTGKYRRLEDIWAARGDGEYKDATVLIGAGLELCPTYDPADSFR